MYQIKQQKKYYIYFILLNDYFDDYFFTYLKVALQLRYCFMLTLIYTKNMNPLC